MVGLMNQRRCEEIVRRWTRGETVAAIADAFGTDRDRMTREIVRMRTAGWDLSMRGGAIDGTVLTDGHDLYVRVRRGVYHRVDRRGRRTGETHSEFEPRPRWRPASRCFYVIAVDGLTCPKCGRYDNGYAETGVRSYCSLRP